MEEGQKKNKVKNFWIGIGFISLVIFVVITSIVLNSKNKELEELKEKNEIAKPTEAVVRIID